MSAVQRLFFLALAFVVILAVGLLAFLFASLWPYFFIIGKVATGVVIVLLLCTAALMVSFTYTKVCNWHTSRHMMVSGEVVVYLASNGDFVHLSAEHERAKLPSPSATVVDAKPSDKETVLELYDAGLSIREVAEKTGVSFYYVQKWTSEVKKKQAIEATKK